MCWLTCSRGTKKHCEREHEKSLVFCSFEDQGGKVRGEEKRREKAAGCEAKEYMEGCGQEE